MTHNRQGKPSRALAVLMVLSLGGCAAAAVQPPAPQPSALYDQYQSNVGKTFWVQSSMQSCLTPQPLWQPGCTMLQRGTRFTIVSVEPESGGAGLPYYSFSLADGTGGFAAVSAVEIAASTVDPAKAAAECKRRGSPQIGMTVPQVVATCWGKPNHVNRTETASVIHDQYVYGGGRYVYLSNGTVTSVQTSGTLR